MNYLKVYCNLIRKAEQRSYTKKKAKELGVYVEGHHTFPKSIFGPNKRIVYLTAREHYIAHALLEKVCIKRYGTNHYRTHKMTYAFWCLNSQKSKNKYLNSYFYKSLRERYSEVHSKKMKIKSTFIGETNPSKKEKRQKEIGLRTKEYLMSLSKEEYCKIYQNRIEKTKEIFKGEGNPFYGKTHSNEVKQIVSNRVKGTKWWNDGMNNIQSFECPGGGWVLGMYFKKHPRLGISRSLEIVEKVRNSNIKYTYTLISPDNEIIETIDISNFCKTYGLSTSKICLVCKGKRNHHKGWKASKKLRDK